MTGEGTIANVAGAMSTFAGAEDVTDGPWWAETLASALIAVKSADPAVANPMNVAIAPPAMTIAQGDVRFLRTFAISTPTALIASSVHLRLPASSGARYDSRHTTVSALFTCRDYTFPLYYYDVASHQFGIVCIARPPQALDASRLSA